MRILKSLLWFGVIILVLLGIYVSVHQIPPNPRAYSPEFAKHPVTTLLHVVPGLIFMLVGPLQFVPMLRRKYPKMHRMLGYLFFGACICIGCTALVIANWFPTGGPGERWIMGFFSLLFLFFLYKAWVHIRNRRVLAHRENMIRVFALGLAVSVFRIVMALMVFAFDMDGIRYIELNFAFSFCGMWGLAELWIWFSHRGHRIK